VSLDVRETHGHREMPGPPRLRAGFRSPALRPWLVALAVMLITHVVFMGVAVAASWLLASGDGPPSVGLVDLWYRFDADHLLKVAEFGYTDPRTFEFPTVFFPLFPLTVRALTYLGVPLSVAGLLVPAISSLVAFAFLYRLAEDDIGHGAGRIAVLFLGFFPTGFFMVAPYTEALFLAGAIPAFYYARRGQWWRAALPTAVAVATRNTGIFLLLGLAVEFLRQRKYSWPDVRRGLLAVTLGALPLIFYCAYLWLVFGDPFRFIADYGAGWNRHFTDPYDSLVVSLSMTRLADYPTNWMMAMRGELIAMALGIGVTAWTIARREWGYAVFCGSLLAVLATGPFFYSVPRALLVLFPTCLFLTEAGYGRQSVREGLLAIMLAIATLGAVVYTQGGWFY
jgi:hypothetical protein